MPTATPVTARDRPAPPPPCQGPGQAAPPCGQLEKALDYRARTDPDLARRMRRWLVRQIAERAVQMLADEE